MLWHVLHAVTLHFLWSDRNWCLFYRRQFTPALVAIQVILTTFFRSRSVSLPTDDAVERLSKVLQKLKTHPAFSEFVQRFPCIINVREPAKRNCFSNAANKRYLIRQVIGAAFPAKRHFHFFELLYKRPQHIKMERLASHRFRPDRPESLSPPRSLIRP
ncbi:hypothetical protein Plhal304r1_c031g0101551 [Plasmopara halstedii]